jgi:hypothetical protein
MACKLRKEMLMQGIHEEEVFLAIALIEEGAADVGIE